MAGDINKSVNVAINIVNGVTKQVKVIADSFSKLVDSTTKANKAVLALNQSLNKLRAPKGMAQLGTDLKDISKVNAKGVNELALGIDKLSKVKFPSFSTINNDLIRHAKLVRDVVNEYKNLSAAAAGVNLKGLSSNANSAGNSIKNLGKNSKDTGASFSQWGYAIGSASTGLSKFGTQIYGVTRGFSAVSKEMGLAMAAFTATFTAMFALKGVVKDIAAFDDALRAAGAVSSASSVELQMFSDAARKMGETTRYTATEAAEALKQLAMTGLSVNDAIATLPHMLNLAAAANMDLGKAADIVTNIMVGYGKSVADLPRITDLITAASIESNASIEDLGVSMKYVGPVAKAAGQSIEETTGLLASLADAGYKGSKAGTTLRTAFANLLSPTKKMQEALDHYGITMDQLTGPDGKLISMTKILGILKDKSVTTGDALTLFGKYAGPGMLALLSQGIPALEKMNQKMQDAEGTALKVAYEMEAGLGGTLRELQSMWEELSLAIGKTIEKDVQSFLKRITSSLKENKDAIVNVVSGFFQFIGVFAKLIGWITSFVASHFKMVAALTAIGVALKLLTMTSQQFMAIGIVSGLSKLITGVKWSVGIVGIQGVTGALISMTNAVKAGGLAAAGSTLATFISGVANGGAATTIKAIGSSLLFMAKSAGELAAALYIANPPLAIIAGIATAAYIAIRVLEKDYEKIASAALKSADSAKELNRTLEYQSAELKLLSKAYKEEGVTDFSNAEVRLTDLIRKSNIPLEDRIEYMKRARSSTDEARKVVEELTEKLNEEKKANDAKIIQKSTEARDANAKAVEAQAKKIEYWYGINVDGRSRLNALEKARSLTNEYAAITWLKKQFGLLDKNIEKYEKLRGEQAVINKNYEGMIATMVVGKKSVDEFQAALAKSGASQEGIDKATESFKKLVAEAENDKKVMEDLQVLSANGMEKLEENARGELEILKNKNTERNAIEQQTNYNIAVLEAQGVLTHEEAEMAKLQATLDSSNQMVQDAKDTYEKINQFAAEGRAEAMEKIAEAEGKSAEIRLQMLTKIGDAEQKLKDKVVDLSEKKTNEVTKHETELSRLKNDLTTKEKEAESAKNDRVTEINLTLKNKLAEIDNDIQQKRKEHAAQRLEIERSTASAIAGVYSSGEDKLRAIRQRSMSEEEKNADNRIAAQNKLSEGIKLVQEAELSGDSAKFERGKGIISQSQELFSGIQDQNEAAKGVIETTNALAEAEKAKGKITLAEANKKIAIDEAEATRQKKLAEDAAQNDISVAEREFKQKTDAATKYYNEEKTREDNDHNTKIQNIEAEISKYGSKLGVLGREKELILSLIEEQKRLSETGDMSKVWEEANKKTQEAIGKTKEFGDAIKGLENQKVNVSFTGEASEILPLGAKIEQIKGWFKDISSEILVTVHFKDDQGKSLSESLASAKTEIESIKIILPILMNNEQIEATIKLINEIKESSIKVVVVVDKGDLINTAAILKDIQSKIVNLTIKVSGLDLLTRAKNAIDSIPDNTYKTVTITTKNVTAKASGGIIGGPEHYATGGNVFKRLSSQYIASGGGTKDDVPAMLMKGEFVQKVSAVKKYGKSFMAKLNAGLIPQSVSKMFNAGGYVEPEYYATGGSVGAKQTKAFLNILPFNKRKEIFDLFAMKSAAIGSKINGTKTTTELGATTLKQMGDSFSDVVSAFASGGNISESIVNFSSQKKLINDTFNEQIKLANGQGKSEIATILKKERDDLISISTSLKSELNDLKEEYEKNVNDKTDDYTKTKTDKREAYESELSADELANKRAEDDSASSYAESKLEYEKKRQEALDELNKQLAELGSGDMSQSTILEKILEAKNAVETSFKEFNAQGQLMSYSKYGAPLKSSNATEAAKQHSDNAWGGDYDSFLDNYENKGLQYYWPKNEDTPNFAWFEELINGGGLWHQKRQQVPSGSQKAELKKRYDPAARAVQSALVKLDEALLPLKTNYGSGGFKTSGGMFNTSGVNAFDTLRNSGSYEKLSKQISDLMIKTESDSIKKESNVKISEIDDDFNKTTKDHNKEDYRRKQDYQISRKEKDNDYEKDLKSDESSYENSIKELKNAYEKAVKEKTSASAEKSKQIKQTALDDIATAKDNLQTKITEAKTTRNGSLASLLEQNPNLETTTTDYGSDSIIDKLRKKFGIKGFNTGGFVNNTSTSIRGKDSILASLTPEEYVIKAPVVRKLGKGFFDSINNFRVPGFNVGGLVGSGALKGLSSASNVVKHVLELSINGSKQGELTGSPITIEKILNDLTLAKMRS